jgi:ParB family chromosome partitioning protein
VGHAKVILGLANEVNQRAAAERIIKDSLSVRQTEHLVARLLAREAGSAAKPGQTAPLPRDAHLSSLEAKLRERLGTKVHLRYAHGKGAVEITFFSDADLERILQILGVSPD